MLLDEPVLVSLHLRCECRPREQLLLQRLLAQCRGGLHVLGDTGEHLSRLLLILVHLFCDVVLKYFFDELRKLSYRFVEQWEELVCLEAQVTCKLVDRLELESHASHGCRLHI